MLAQTAGKNVHPSLVQMLVPGWRTVSYIWKDLEDELTQLCTQMLSCIHPSNDRIAWSHDESWRWEKWPLSEMTSWQDDYPIYQPLRSSRIWHKVSF